MLVSNLALTVDFSFNVTRCQYSNFLFPDWWQNVEIFNISSKYTETKTARAVKAANEVVKSYNYNVDDKIALEH